MENNDDRISPEQQAINELVARKVAGRPGPSYRDILEADGHGVPPFLELSWEDLGNENIPIERYISPEFARLEVAKVWRKAWQMVCREEELAKPGDSVVYDIAEDSFVVVRTKDGSIKAHQNACLHRGRRLRSRDGRVPEIRCPFHGLTWDLDGKLKDLPCAWDFEHLDRSKMNLPQAKVDTWGGYVFINMDPDCGPLREQLGAVPDHFKVAAHETRVKTAHVAQLIPCNWKVAQEAFMEAWHLTQTHPQSAPSAGDVTTQVDIVDATVSRTLTPVGVASPNLLGLDEQDIYENYLEGRTFYQERLGVIGTKDVAREEINPELPEGRTAREQILGEIRKQIGATMSADIEDVPPYLLVDALEYFVFPNFFPWLQEQTNQVYRFRPNGMDPDSCIVEVMFLTPFPEGTKLPKPAKIHWLKPGEDWADAAELGRLASTVNQDTLNVPEIQKGLKVLARTQDGIPLASYQESRIRHFHHLLTQWIEKD
ncbi:aromatic ring-hydroxylating oxygenase subunit alpha [Nocardia rhamnosiphila]|uniref:Aromatic ring-hydroxylating dioxygenase subunit alpha n=1 Tax=Nocardia rhamnosiphila TaxID=426716 RepID=A0ABV2WYM2_9NOCA